MMLGGFMLFMNKYNIVLAGNPNVGKSTIFNYLTGLKQHTGNWSGKTIDSALGNYLFNNNKYFIYDSPGMYSLIPHSKEEVIARDIIFSNNNIDCIVVVCDAVNLKRSLNLVMQILEVNSNVLMVVNLMDEAFKRGIVVDLDKLSSILGIRVVGTSATYRDGMKEMLEGIEYVCNSKCNIQYKICYDDDIEKKINLISKYIDNDKKRWISIRILCGDKYLDKYMTGDIRDILSNCNTDDIESRVCYKIIYKCHDIYNSCVNNNNLFFIKERKIDKILTSKIWGIPIMLISLFFIFWLTIVFSNYPSEVLSNFLFGLEDNLYNMFSFLPDIIRNILIYGVYRTVSWVVGVMLPPMLIFFPLFTILEDIGFLPRIAFNMDGMFSKCNACGKQCLTMCMGIGCNAVGVVGSRIIDDKRERILAIITNSFMPCNGRYPVIIAVISMFFVNSYRRVLSSLLISFILLLFIVLGIVMTFLVCYILSKILYKDRHISFVLELPCYRHIRVHKVIMTSLFDRTIFVLGRAMLVASFCGIVLYSFSNISINGVNIITFLSNFLDSFGCLIGLDGVILLAYFLGLPANEIVLPIILMIYLNTGLLTNYDSLDGLKEVLVNNGWNTMRAICFIIFCIFHFPCGTTLLTIKSETNSYFYTFLAFIIPLVIGFILCLIVNFFGLFFI